MKNEKVDYTGVYIVKIDKLEKEIERLNNDIKELLKENSNKEKVIKIQDNIINKAIKKLEYYNSGEALYYVPIQNIIDILKGDDKE